jgi:FlaA1/EpsC-like NDP-sugar epimerase
LRRAAQSRNSSEIILSSYALQPFQLAIDVVLVGVAWLLVFWLRFNLDIPDEFLSLAWATAPWVMVTYGVGLQISRVYRHVWRYIGLPELRQLTVGVAFCGVLATAVVLVQRLPNFPRSVLASHPLIVLLLLGAVRATWRTLSERQVTGGPAARRLLIVGTLHDAADALRALKGSQQWAPVGILSPEPGEKGKSLQNVGVLGLPADVAQVATATGARTALIASPPGSKERTEVLMNASGASVTLLTMPRPDEWLKTETTGPAQDRAGGPAWAGRRCSWMWRGWRTCSRARRCWSLARAARSGRSLCRQIARFGVSRLVCVDVSEFGVYQLEQELREAHPQMHAAYYTANVREPAALALAIAERHRPAVVFHAAAYKHVPLMEDLNAIEAVRTNVLGTSACCPSGW